MKELEKKMQNESFDVEVQYCDTDDCLHDCETAPNHCTVHFTSLWQGNIKNCIVRKGIIDAGIRKENAKRKLRCGSTAL